MSGAPTFASQHAGTQSAGERQAKFQRRSLLKELLPQAAFHSLELRAQSLQSIQENCPAGLLEKPCRGGASESGDGSSATTAMLHLYALECGVCLSLVCQPISLSCGHTFCRVCLINTLRRNRKKCPTCRAVCHNSAEDQPEDVMIANIARMCFPELAQKRLMETEADTRNLMAVVPIFYYNLPMFPGETLNLHLFEPRYKLMMQRIVNTSRRFAYVPNYRDYSSSVGDVALIAELCECEFLSDGRVLLAAKLTSRQTMIDHFVEEGTQGLHYCRLEARSDDPLMDASAAAEVAQLHSRTSAMVNGIVQPIRAQVVARYGDMPATAEGLSLWAASVLPMPVQEKHALLAGTCTRSRLMACERHLLSLGGSSPPAPPQRVPASTVAAAYVRHLAVSDDGDGIAAAVAAGPAGNGGGFASGPRNANHAPEASTNEMPEVHENSASPQDTDEEQAETSSSATSYTEEARTAGASAEGDNRSRSMTVDEDGREEREVSEAVEVKRGELVASASDDANVNSRTERNDSGPVA